MPNDRRATGGHCQLPALQQALKLRDANMSGTPCAPVRQRHPVHLVSMSIGTVTGSREMCDWSSTIQDNQVRLHHAQDKPATQLLRGLFLGHLPKPCTEGGGELPNTILPLSSQLLSSCSSVASVSAAKQICPDAEALSKHLRPRPRRKRHYSDYRPHLGFPPPRPPQDETSATCLEEDLDL